MTHNINHYDKSTSATHSIVPIVHSNQDNKINNTNLIKKGNIVIEFNTNGTKVLVNPP